MRILVWAVTACCAIGVAGSARAQTGSASTILGGPPPSAIQFRQIDLTNVVTPSTAISAQQNRFNFSALFSKLSTPSYPVKNGVSPLPSPSMFPSFPSFKMVGTPPYQLGNPKAAKNPFQPVPPLIPNTKTPVGPGS